MMISKYAPQSSRNSYGFSLINLVIGMGLLSIIAMTGAYLSIQTKRTSTQGELLHHLNQDHILALQKSKSAVAMKAALAISPTSPIGQCLAGRGVACNTLAVHNWAPIAMLSSSRVDPGNRTIATAGNYILECTTAASCEGVVVKVESTLHSGTSLLYKRQSEVRLGGIFLSDRREIDFSCVAATGGLMTALNMKTLRGECLPLPTASACPSSRPLTVFHVGSAPGCQPSTTLNCPTGFRSVGILSGQGGCI